MKAIFDAPGFFAALDAIRESRALNWKQVGEEAGIPTSTLTRLTKGSPSVETLARLKCWMGISIDRFFRMDGQNA